MNDRDRPSLRLQNTVLTVALVIVVVSVFFAGALADQLTARTCPPYSHRGIDSLW